MSSIKGKTVYSVLYNYGDSDYSLIKIMEKLDDAFDYICIQENLFYKSSDIGNFYHLIEITKEEDVKNHLKDNIVIICFVKSKEYNFNVSSYNGVSPYIIVPFTIA